MSARRDVEWILGRLGVAEADFPSLRKEGLTRIDALRRGRVRKALQEAITTASLGTQHADDEGHVHRLAFLSCRKKEASSDELEVVRAAFTAELERMPTRAPSRFVATGKLAALMALTCAAVLFVTLAPDHWLDPTKLPVARGAFANGGRPDPGGNEVQQFFGTMVPEFVVALDVYSSSSPANRMAASTHLDEVVEKMLGQAGKALGGEPTASLRMLVQKARALVEANAQSEVDPFMHATDMFNASLEREALGYYLDAEVGATGRGPRVYLASFAVERVRWYRAGTKRVRALHLARRDNLNFVRSLLGFTRPNIRDALVLLERVDFWLIDTLLPALAAEAPFELAHPGPRWQPPENVGRVSLRLGQEVRREVANKVKACAVLEDTGSLFMRRKQALLGMQERVVRFGMQMSIPNTYDVEIARFAAAEQVAFAEFQELRHVRTALDDERHRACFRALAATLVEGIDRHEVQHRLDYASGALERMPYELGRRVGSLEKFGGQNVLARRALAETSAYLSELARGPELVKLNLGWLAGFVLEPNMWGSAEYYAALVIFEGLARELGLSSEDAPQRKPTERVVDQLGLFLAMEDDELARAAHRLWRNLMGEPLPKLVLETSGRE